MSLYVQALNVQRTATIQELPANTLQCYDENGTVLDWAWSDISKSFDGPYVWLVTETTDDINKALGGFRVNVTTTKDDNAIGDMGRIQYGIRDYYRYLYWTKDQVPVNTVALVRTTYDLNGKPPWWATTCQFITMNIAALRDGDYIWLMWGPNAIPPTWT